MDGGAREGKGFPNKWDRGPPLRGKWQEPFPNDSSKPPDTCCGGWEAAELWRLEATTLLSRAIIKMRVNEHMSTDQEYIALLAAADDPARFEFPEGYDRQAAKIRFGRFADDLDAALGIKAERDTYVEDASYLADYFLPTDFLAIPIDLAPLPPNQLPSRASVTISNWGNFSTIFGEDHLRPDLADKIRQVLNKDGYTFIPQATLELPYEGPWASHLESPVTWGRRYFAYG